MDWFLYVNGLRHERVKGDTLAEIRYENALKVEDKPAVCPTSLVVDKALKVLQQVTPFCEKCNIMREGPGDYETLIIMKRDDEVNEKTINHYFKKFQILLCVFQLLKGY